MNLILGPKTFEK